MQILLDKYKDLLLRTRWFGVISAAVICLLGLLDLIDGGTNIYIAENAISSIKANVLEIGIVVAVVIASAYRLRLLSQKERLTYRASAVTWLICTSLLALGWELFRYKVDSDLPANCVPEPGKLCFGFYTDYRPSLTQAFAWLFIIGGVIRSIATLIAASVEARTCLK